MADTTRIPIDFRSPRVTSLAGNCTWTVDNLSTADVDQGWWRFAKDAEGKLYGLVSVPVSLGATPAAKIILILQANATAGATQVQVSTLAIADGESPDQAYTAETAQTVTVAATAYAHKEVTFTLTAAPVSKDVLYIEVFHDGDHASDTLAVDTLMPEAYLEIDQS